MECTPNKESLKEREGNGMMDKYDVLGYIEKINATLVSVSRGDSAATDEYALFVSEDTISELVDAANHVKEYMLDIFRTEDENLE